MDMLTPARSPSEAADLAVFILSQLGEIL